MTTFSARCSPHQDQPRPRGVSAGKNKCKTADAQLDREGHPSLTPQQSTLCRHEALWKWACPNLLWPEGKGTKGLAPKPPTGYHTLLMLTKNDGAWDLSGAISQIVDIQWCLQFYLETVAGLHLWT